MTSSTSVASRHIGVAIDPRGIRNQDPSPSITSVAGGKTPCSVGIDTTPASTSIEALSELIRRSVQGDTEAFGRIYDLFFHRVHRYALYISANANNAEDVTEEVFVKAWQKLPSFHGGGAAFQAWLFRIAHNHVVDLHRQQRTDSLPMSAYGAELVAPPEEGTQATAERQLLGRQVLQLARELPPQQRQVIVLKLIEGLSNKEISGVTGQREGAIRIAQMRALQTLRARLDGEAGPC
jgi:RNA polymerase sigma-70 factor (ECF subfamily)